MGGLGTESLDVIPLHSLFAGLLVMRGLPSGLKEPGKFSGQHKGGGPGTARSLDKKVIDLVQLLSIKYVTKQSITKAEMVKTAMTQYGDHFPEIFQKTCECMEFVFGISVKEVEPSGHTYVLVKTLDLTYEGMPSNVQGMPSIGLLIILLVLIFMEGNHVPEEKMWDVLKRIRIFPESPDFIYGEPKKLITRELVKEGYLEYQRIPNSDPPRYELLWGPRAYKETSKMKVLKFFAKVNGSDARSFPTLYEEALRDEEEKT
ncbi:putative MAGE domain-containing protein MAGEA13P [Echinops telfairi]|uniref:MAGE domain-containing protein MAGEA13P n=1 Tax=Echinops telfairi TaxID=9371 RepID=A0AC55CXR2_ECHTE|nr:putative MAGE domain-containing protein MAGEA13P [Echinops telfairi]